MPKVTILMPVYNVAAYVEEAISSVLQQTYSDFELLIIDDCSTDDTWERVCHIEDPRIHRVHNDHNLGLADNLNKGLSLIHTEYVARMDGDDIALPHWLETEVHFMDQHPDVGVCGGGCKVFGNRNFTIAPPARAEEVAVNMLFECSTTVPTFRTSLYHEQGLHYRSEAFPAEDYRFWVDCLQQTTICNIPSVLYYYRTHNQQISTSLCDQQHHQSDAVRRIMLHRLNSNISNSDADYFIEHYIHGTINNINDYRQMHQFSQHLLELNRQSGYFDPIALHRRLKKQEIQALYTHIIDTYFSNGYRPYAYLRYLSSGCFGHTTLHYEIRFLLKSILHYKQRQ